MADIIPRYATNAEFDQKTGIVWLDDFDHGVVTTLGAVINTAGDTYVIKNMDGVEPPPEFEGVPVYFAFSDDTIDKKIMPSFVIRRDSMSPALSRLQMGIFEYRIPSVNSKPVDITNPRTGDLIASGFDEYELKDQAIPYDLLYTIQIRARFRNNLHVAAQKMLRYAMRIYQPYTSVTIKDSLGDYRTYDAFMESPSMVDIKSTVADRETNFNMSLRVEAELDINDPVVRKSLSSLPGITTGLR
jgi:hypothetical protein